VLHGQAVRRDQPFPGELLRLRQHVGGSEAFQRDRGPLVAAGVKNDHLGFDVTYVFNSVDHRYVPDFLVRLAGGATLVLEVKDRDSQQNQTKRDALAEWVGAVNRHGSFGRWTWDVSPGRGRRARHPREARRGS